MATIKPFKALRYNKEKVDSIAEVLSPPYDVITPEKREKLYEQSVHNITRVDFPIPPEQGDVYELSAKILDEWEKDQLLVTESQPAIYITEEAYVDFEGVRRVRRGFIARMKVEDYSSGTIFPHERTFPKHKGDRMRLLKATKTQFNPVFGFYSDSDSSVSTILKNVVGRSAPDWTFDFEDGATRSIWTMTDQKEVAQVVEAMSPRKVFIADGHHRYETSLEYSKLMDKENGTTPAQDLPYHYTLMYFVAMEDEGLTILPTHRLLRDIKDFDKDNLIKFLEKGFDVKEMERQAAIDRIYKAPGSQMMFVQVGEKCYAIEAKAEAIAANNALQELHETVRKLNVSICEKMIIRPLIGEEADLLSHVAYVVAPEDVSNKIKNNECQFAVYLAPIHIKDVEPVAMATQVMPQKSTFFFPKLITGLVMYRHPNNNS